MVERPSLGGLRFGILLGKSEVHARENALRHRRRGKIARRGSSKLRPVDFYAKLFRVPRLQLRPCCGPMPATIGSTISDEEMNLIEANRNIERGALYDFNLYAIRTIDISAIYAALWVCTVADDLHALRFHLGHQCHAVFHQKANVVHR